MTRWKGKNISSTVWSTVCWFEDGGQGPRSKNVYSWEQRFAHSHKGLNPTSNANEQRNESSPRTSKQENTPL